MIEKLSHEVATILPSIFYDGLEEGRPVLRENVQNMSRKMCLAFIRKEGQERKEILPEDAEDYQTAYLEIEELLDEEFEVLRQELMTLEVVDSLPS
ncbi:TPA: hypothetical protein U1B12_001082 [Streptococcus suis]|uniref:hypothetical protein n=1 Tax=Streptococcus suis TaxID=1307 RepID=UPI000CF4F71A|nr:hypothetical protein [Streptococcus suis]MCK4023941.1 hypothetical protein [Streptococcus suis]MCO8200860.1 hypothetical protein [Streptococcus suis]MCO8218397.1 hypothetical protein [Streptococcus suis]HEM3467947.1 hypothetical protein [Streptococcus suis]HEM3478658.1 hypothetical protein [Streptococcus suis]